MNPNMVELTQEMVDAGFRLVKDGIGAYADLGILSIDIACFRNSQGESKGGVPWVVYLGDTFKVVRIERVFKSFETAMAAAMEFAKAAANVKAMVSTGVSPAQEEVN